MAIYRNENVNSLPEQVQENKDNIKQINEILENIDPEQVATILSDIQALKAEQVVQNTAIGSNTQNIGNNTTAINNEKTARESVVGVNVSGNTYLNTATPKRQIIIENNGYISLLSGNGNALILTPQGEVQLASVDTIVSCIANEGVKLQANTSAINPFELVLKNTGDFEVKNGHVLKFDTTGALTIDGQPIGGGGGGGKQLYAHNIEIYKTSTPYLRIALTIINDSNVAFNRASLYDYLVNNVVRIQATGFYVDTNVKMSVCRIWASLNTYHINGYSNPLADSQVDYDVVNLSPNNISVGDVIITL